MDRAITLDELLELWDAYVDFRAPSVSPSTVKRDYAAVRKRILLMQDLSPDIDNARGIRKWLLDYYSRNTAKRTLVQFNACGNWAVFEDLLPWNPFTGLQRYLSQRKDAEDTFVAFTAEERGIIIQTFTKERPKYWPWVAFLMYSGCRPEEAAALKWSHVAVNFSQLAIAEACPQDTKILQSTKNYRTTRFPCNAQMQALLGWLWEHSAQDRNHYLFKSVQGGNRPFNYISFQTHIWRPVVKRLVEEGRVAFYGSQYNCRHTFISELVPKMELKDVSYLCRVSVGTLMRVYCDRSRVIEVPEI